MKMDRLLEIANEAGFMIEGDKAYVGDMFGSINDILRDFAELIIQECVEVSDLALTEEYDTFLPSEMIAKHFNLEFEE
jgi:hypothetical protein